MPSRRPHRVAVLDVQASVGPVAELGRVAVGKPDQRQDHGRRQQAGERLDVVELVLTVDGVEEVVADLGDLGARGRRCAGA